MDNNPQPGQIYKPNNQEDTPGESAAVPNEIDAIDNAMKQVPVAAEQPVAESLNSQMPKVATPDKLNPTSEASSVQEANPEPTPEPVNQPTTEPLTPEGGDDNQDSTALLTWQAAEPVEAGQQSKRAAFLLTGVVALLIVGVVIISGFNFGTIISILVMLSALAAIVVSSNQHNRLETYAIYDGGVSIGSRFYAFSELKSFSLISYGMATSIEIDPTQRFMMRLVMHLESGSADQAVDLLSQNLPREDRDPSFIDRISGSLKF